MKSVVQKIEKFLKITFIGAFPSNVHGLSSPSLLNVNSGFEILTGPNMLISCGNSTIIFFCPAKN